LSQIPRAPQQSLGGGVRFRCIRRPNVQKIHSRHSLLDQHLTGSRRHRLGKVRAHAASLQRQSTPQHVILADEMVPPGRQCMQACKADQRIGSQFVDLADLAGDATTWIRNRRANAS
jgi:hypothetical protein